MGTIINSGQIRASGNYFAVSLFNGSTLTALTNSGTISSTSASQGGGINLATGGPQITTLTNTGTITSPVTGITISDGATIGTLDNSGLLQGGTAANRGALRLGTTAALGVLHNTGTILGNIEDTRTSGTLTIAGGSGTAFGTLSAASGTATLSSNGNIAFTGNTRLHQNVVGGGTVTNTGILQVTRNIQITGSYQQTGTLLVGVANTASHGALTASGAVTMTNSTVVMQTVTGGTLAYGLYTIARGNTGSDYTGVSASAGSLTVSTSTSIVGNYSYLYVSIVTPPPTVYWDGSPANAANGTIDGGSGTWSATGTLFTRADGMANATLDGNPIFQGNAGTVTVDTGAGAIAVAGMTFACTGYVLTGGTITLSDAQSTIEVGSGLGATLAAPLGGTGGLVKAGAGTLSVAAAGYGGATTIAAGRLSAAGTIGAVTIASGATLAANGLTTGAIVNVGTLELGTAVLTANGNITGTGTITFAIGSASTGYIVNSSGAAAYTPGSGTVSVVPTIVGGSVSDGTRIALIHGGSAAPGLTGTTITVTATGTATWTASAGTAYAGQLDYNGHTIVATDMVLVASVPPTPAPVSTPATPTPPTTETPPTTVTPPNTGVIDTSQPIFDNNDSAVQATTVVFDGGTLRPSLPLTLTQPVTVTDANGTVDANGSTLTLSGTIGGDGQLAVAGSGVVVVSSTVSNSGGLAVQAGTLMVAGGGTVAAPLSVTGGTVTVAEGGTVGGTVVVDGGTVTVAGGGSVTGAVTVGDTGGGGGGGTFAIESGGTLEGAMTLGNGGVARVDGTASGAVVVGSGATLAGTGRIAGSTSVSGILSPGDSPGTLEFTAPVTLDAGSVFLVEIDGPGTGTGAGNHDRVVTTGETASFTAGGRLTPVLRGIAGPATNSYTPELGRTFTVVEAEGGLLGQFAALDQPADGLAAGTRIDALYGATTLALAVTPANYGDLPAAGLAQSANQRAVGTALEHLRPAAGTQSADAAEQALFDALYPLSAARIGPALDALSGEIHADTLAAARAARRLFGRAVETRQAAGRGSDGGFSAVGGVVRFEAGGGARAETGVAAGTGGPGTAAAMGASLWGQPLVAWSRTDGDGNGAGADRTAGGFLVGSDIALAPEVRAGVAAGYLRTDVDARGGLGDGTVDSYQVTLYGSWTPGIAFVDAALGYGFSQYETSRSAVVGATAGAATGKANGHDLSAEVSAGFRTALSSVWIEPRAALRWDRTSREGFTERGTQPIALAVGEATDTALRSSLGVRVGTRVGTDGTTVEPSLLLGWDHEWRDPAARSQATFGGAGYTVRAASPGRDAAVVGVGVGVSVNDSLSLHTGYLGAFRSGETSHAASLGVRWSW